MWTKHIQENLENRFELKQRVCIGELDANLLRYSDMKTVEPVNIIICRTRAH